MFCTMNCLFIYILISFFSCAFCQKKQEICEAEDIADTNIEQLTYSNSEPNGFRSAKVTMLKNVKVKSLNECVKHCCYYKNCTAVSIVRNSCLLFHCKTKLDCKAVKMADIGQNMIYINFMKFLSKKKSDKTTGLWHEKEIDEDSQPCELSIHDNCPANSICKSIQEDRRTGVCVCMTGFVKKSYGCIEDNTEVKEVKVEPIINVTTIIPVIESKDLLTRDLTNIKTKKQSIVKNVTEPSSINIIASAGPDLHIKVSNPRLSSSHQVISIRGSAVNKEGVVLLEGVTYEWKRDPKSLAVGSILNDSDHCDTLMLISLLRGQYTFLLTVTDKNGLHSSDSVNIFATESSDIDFSNLVDVLLEADIFKFVQQESINFSRRMVHIIEKNLQYSNCQVHVRSVTSNDENKTLLSFYAESIDPNTKESKIIPAGILEEKLKMKLTKHQFIFDYSILKFQSRVCFNSCGGHGTCSNQNHRCKCNFPWLNNPWHERSTGFSNCHMHVMIIIVICAAVMFITVLFIITLRTFIRKCRRRNRFSKETLRYKILDNTES